MAQVSLIRFKIAVQDFGDGMPQEKLKCLFQDFSKLEDNNNKNA